MKIRQKHTNDRKPTQKGRSRVVTQIGGIDPQKASEATRRGFSGAQRREWPVVDGMARFCALTHFPYELLKLIIKNGSECKLSGSRIDSLIAITDCNDALRTSADELIPDGCASWKDAGDKFSALNEKLKFESNEKTLVPAAEAIRQAGEAGGYFMSQLERWARELPPALAGLTAHEIATRIEIEVERTRTELQKKLNAIGK